MKWIPIALLVVLLLTPVMGSADETELVTWTWSTELKEGIYRWNVTSFNYQGETILTKSQAEDVIEGSILEIEIDEPLFGHNYFDIQNDWSRLPMRMTIDNVPRNTIDLMEVDFLFPVLVKWLNGTQANLYDSDLSTNFFPISNNTRQEDSLIIVENYNSYRYSKLVRNVTTGVLVEWYNRFTGGELVYAYVGYYLQRQVSEDAIEVEDIMARNNIEDTLRETPRATVSINTTVIGLGIGSIYRVKRRPKG